MIKCFIYVAMFCLCRAENADVSEDDESVVVPEDDEGADVPKDDDVTVDSDDEQG